jgi:putative transposase
VTSYELMGNHVHLGARFEAYRRLSQGELEAQAARLYTGRYRPHVRWRERDWERFNRRLFHVSELMRNILMAFGRYYNRRHGRRGPVWAGRYRSTESDHMRETVYYVELNAVRARLVRPEEWADGSCRMRQEGRDQWLMPLEELMGTTTRAAAERLYWTQLYWRGTQPSKPGDGVIPVALAEQMQEQMQAAGLPRGCYLERQAAWSRGMVVGSRELVARRLEQYQQKYAVWCGRSEPVALGWGDLYTLRPQRATALART